MYRGSGFIVLQIASARITRSTEKNPCKVPPNLPNTCFPTLSPLLQKAFGHEFWGLFEVFRNQGSGRTPFLRARGRAGAKCRITVLKVIYNVVIRYLLVAQSLNLFEMYSSSSTRQQSTQLRVMACDGSFSFVNNS